MDVSELWMIFRWWAVMLGLGLLAFPLSSWLFGRLPDRGYAFSKMIALLSVGYLFWLGGMLGFLQNSVGGIVLAVGVVGGTAVVLSRRNRQTGWGWLRTNWRYVLLVELLFTALFLLWTWVRANNPVISGTEKPMEFAFLNSVTRSTSYPPLDPWLSGFSISYYYFGYIMVSIVARLAAVAEPYAFNLGLAWLVAGTGSGAFGLVYNLVALVRPAETEEDGGARGISARAATFALLAAIAIPLAGNNVMLLDTLHGNNVGSPAFWAWLDVQDLDGPPDSSTRYEDNTFLWWWRTSRPIREYHLSGREESGLTPIAEIPSFSFVLGDMHPHVLALPFTFVTMGLALVWFVEGSRSARREDDEAAGGLDWWVRLLRRVGAGRVVATAVVLGGLAFINTWDLPIHLFLLAGAFTLHRWREHGAFRWSLLGEGAGIGLTLGLLAFLFYYPFYMGLSSQAGAPFILPMLMRPTRLVQFLVIFGLPLIPLVALLLSQLWQAPRRRTAIFPAVMVALWLPIGLLLLAWLMAWLIASSSLGTGTVMAIASELGLTLPPVPSGEIFPGWGFQAVWALTPALLQTRVLYIGLTLLLTTIIGLCVYLFHSRLGGSNLSELEEAPEMAAAPATDERGVDVMPFVLLLILTAALLTLGPEYVYLKDNFGQRINTIFKFYYQAWLLFGVAAIFALSYLWRQAKLLGGLITLSYAALLAVALLYPAFAVNTRTAEYRGASDTPDRRPPTLNGIIFIQNNYPDDYAAMQWLRQNAGWDEVVLEASQNAYSYDSRVSAYTGIPTLLGWANHEFQWRGDSTPEPGQRINIVQELFNTTDWEAAVGMLNAYKVNYVFVGQVERNLYDPQGLEKFANNLPVAYANDGVVIYRWEPISGQLP